MRKIHSIARNLHKSQNHHTNPLHTSNSKLQLTEEDMLKYIDYKAIAFPEVNPIELKSQQEGQEVTLANYRYPSQQAQRKGIIYFIHGYGEYCQRYAYLAKPFADAGYDFVGFDQKGFGYSEGRRGFIDSEESVMEDIQNHMDKVDAKYSDASTKKYVIGYSLGGYMACQLSLLRQNYFSSMCLLSPFFDFNNKRKFSKVDEVLESLNRTNPTRKVIQFPMKPLPPRYILHFIVDPISEAKEIPVRNLVILKNIPLKFTEDKYQNIVTPFIAFIGGKEQIVDNSAIQKFYEINGAQDKELVMCQNADHMIFHDKEQVSFLTEKIIKCFDKY